MDKTNKREGNREKGEKQDRKKKNCKPLPLSALESRDVLRQRQRGERNEKVESLKRREETPPGFNGIQKLLFILQTVHDGMTLKKEGTRREESERQKEVPKEQGRNYKETKGTAEES
jgi:hypothetical protein